MNNSTPFRSEFLRVLEERGFVHQATDLSALDAHFADAPRRAYVGYDMTAQSLHIGNLITLMMLRWLQKTGHQPIILTGTATTKIGDPTDKSQQRPLLTDDQVLANKAHIRKVFSRLVDYGGARPAIEVDNADWLEKVGYVDFLQRYGGHFTINRMLSFDSVKLRLGREHPMTFLEFNYMLMQAVDYLELAAEHDCCLQMGGSDQWGNIINGVEITRRLAGRQVFGLTTPLLMNADGMKMGKTVGGAVWLNAEQFSPEAYWRFWRDTDDRDTGKLLRLFTDLDMDEIRRLEDLGGSEKHIAKVALADEATSIVHGPETTTLVRAA